MNESTRKGNTGHDAREEREYRWLFALTFPVFLLVAVHERIAGAGGKTGRSLLEEARAAAHVHLPYAFMR